MENNAWVSFKQFMDKEYPNTELKDNADDNRFVEEYFDYLQGIFAELMDTVFFPKYQATARELLVLIRVLENRKMFHIEDLPHVGIDHDNKIMSEIQPKEKPPVVRKFNKKKFNRIENMFYAEDLFHLTEVPNDHITNCLNYFKELEEDYDDNEDATSSKLGYTEIRALREEFGKLRDDFLMVDRDARVHEEYHIMRVIRAHNFAMNNCYYIGFAEFREIKAVKDLKNMYPMIVRYIEVAAWS